MAICNEFKHLELDFNNGMIEIYNVDYKDMAFHTDQSLDLDHYICIFSCYSNPNTQNLRKLITKNKSDGNENTIVLNNNSIVVFSVDTNSMFRHKIVLPKTSVKENVKWLGITFRRSKTFIHFVNELPFFICEKQIQLTLATQDEKVIYYKYKGLENSDIDFIYPQLTYTISVGDLIPIEL